MLYICMPFICMLFICIVCICILCICILCICIVCICILCICIICSCILCIVFYALYTMQSNFETRYWRTDRPTDGQTLPDIELLSQLKIWKLKTASFFSKRKTTSNKLKMENDLIFLKMGDNLLSKVLRSEPPSPYYYFYCIFRWISFKIFKFLKWIQISDKFSKVLRLHPLSHHSYFLLHF